ncbi:MAG: hypothetical protein AAFO17_17100, partial [Pseudomonadota bacterium]
MININTLFYDDFYGIKWTTPGVHRIVTWSTVDNALIVPGIFGSVVPVTVALDAGPYLPTLQRAFDLWDEALDHITFVKTDEGNDADVTLAFSNIDGGGGTFALWNASWSDGIFDHATIRFDPPDISGGYLLTTALHEIGNILGLGDIWPTLLLQSVQEDPFPEMFFGNALWPDDVEIIRTYYQETDQPTDLLYEGTVDADLLTDGGGNSTLNGYQGADELNGSAGDDQLNGMRGADLLNGGNGFDTLNGGSGNDSLNGGAFGDTLIGGNGRDTLNGQNGHDNLKGGALGDVLFGGDGRDTLYGQNGHDTLKGGALGDVLFGGDGRDTLYGQNGNDSLNGGALGDVLIGGSGRDTMNGGDGNDRLVGGADADILNGNDGKDTLLGGSGSDTLEGGRGNDILTGGSDSDVFIFSETFGDD